MSTTAILFATSEYNVINNEWSLGCTTIFLDINNNNLKNKINANNNLECLPLQSCQTLSKSPLDQERRESAKIIPKK